ncbi:MAG TPA: tetratricopeptide repeat protein [Pyrinomonadaceae bacterium]|nr:tetratricopeptide repeat protein [Pyrinomonadaceae bacterium]
MFQKPLRIYVSTIFFLFVFTLVGPANSQAKDNWTRVNSKSFTLIGNASEKEIRQVATRLEQFRDVFTRLFSAAKFDTPVPTTVIVFKSMGSYKPFNPGNNAGYFQPGEDVNYITLTTDATQNPFSVIYHEYVHLLVDNTSGNMPVWFNEGLAEYYSAFNIEEDRKVHLGELIPYHLETLREGKLYPLRSLFAVDHYSPEYNEGSKRGMFYAESWALVHYLILGNGGQRLPQLGKFLQLLTANVAVDEAASQAFQTDLDTLQKEFKKYIEGHTFRMQIATFERKLEFDNEISASPVTEAEAQAYLGDLLLHTNQLKDAETRLQQALALDPKLTMAQASLGIVRMRQSRFDEAKGALREAVNANSNNYLTHYYYAYVVSRDGMDSANMVRGYSPDAAEIMRAELKKAIALKPDFPGSYSLLAFVNMVTGEQLDEAIELLKRALALSPGKQDLSLQLAQIYLRQQKFDLARQTLEPLRNARDRRHQQQAVMLLDSIKRYEGQISQFKGSGASSESGPPPLRRKADTSTTANDEKEEAPQSESDYLREALRPLAAGEQRVQGTFLKLDCDNKGVAYFSIQAADRVYRIRSTALQRVQLTAYTPAPANVSCGPRKTPENVVLTYRPTSDPKDAKAKIEGDAIAVELVPKDFTLKKN